MGVNKDDKYLDLLFLFFQFLGFYHYFREICKSIIVEIGLKCKGHRQIKFDSRFISD